MKRKIELGCKHKIQDKIIETPVYHNVSPSVFLGTLELQFVVSSPIKIRLWRLLEDY